jgi:hypothetical protein
MPRAYPVGYEMQIRASRGPYGPTVSLVFIPGSEEIPQTLEGMLSYEAFGDLEAFFFALLSETEADPF